MTVARDLARWALDLRLDDVPVEVRHAACRHLLDGFGTALAAARMQTARAAFIVADECRTADGPHVIGHELRAPAPMTALANGALVHGLDFDDTHAGALVHATAAVLPSAFAVGEEVGASGADVLAAAIVGYETVIRLGAAAPHAFHERGLHATSVCGVFAAAIVTARLMGAGVDAAVNALGIAGSQAAGSLEFLHTGSSTKQLHPGLASMNGIFAARLAAYGADGPSSIFEGEYGLYRVLAGIAVDPEHITGSLGRAWETTRITIKPYPACQLSHASLDAARALDLKAADIESLTFELPPGSIPIVCEPFAAKRKPRTPYEGKFSLPYCAATLLTDGELGVDSFDGDKLARVDVLDLAARIGHRARAFEGAPADAPGIVEARARDGRVLRAEVECSSGGPRAPLSDAALIAKFSANAGARDEELTQRVLNLADLGFVSEVFA